MNLIDYLLGQYLTRMFSTTDIRVMTIGLGHENGTDCRMVDKNNLLRKLWTLLVDRGS